MNARRVMRWIVMTVISAFIAVVVALVLQIAVSPSPFRRGEVVSGVLVLASILVAASAIPIAIITYVSSVVARRRAGSVLAFIEQAVMLNLPLPRIFASIAETEPQTRFAKAMNDARDALERGAPLAAVLSDVPAMPLHVVRVLASAERVGRVPQVMERLMRQRHDALKRHRLLTFELTYPFVVALVCIVVVSLFTIFVAPKFFSIFRDFNTEMPPVTMSLIDFSRTWGNYVVVAFILVVCTVFFLLREPGRAAPGLAESRREWILNRLPWIGTMRVQHGLGEVLDFAADAVDAGRPVEAALLEAGEIPVNSKLRHVLQRWVHFMTLGESMSRAAARANLPKLVSGMLATQHGNVDTAETLRFLGRHYANRFSRSIEFLRAAIVPVSALVLGLVVAWIALSLFAPMLSLLESVSSPKD